MSVEGITSVSSGSLVTRPAQTAQVQEASNIAQDKQGQSPAFLQEKANAPGGCYSPSSNFSTEDFLNLRTSAQSSEAPMSVVKLAMMMQILKQLDQMSQDITAAAFGG